MADIPGLLQGASNIGSSVSDLLFGGGVTEAKVDADKAEADAFGKGAAIEGQNAALADESTNIQKYQLRQAVNQTVGKQRAAVAANGFGEGGSALYLERESTLNGALSQGALTVQGHINQNAYLASQTSMEGEQTAAEDAAKAAEEQRSASVFGDILGTIGGIAKVASGFGLFGKSS